jgi:hypothetical protein
VHAVVRSYGILIIGLVLMGLGVAFVTPATRAEGFGWYAYRPGPEVTLLAAPLTMPGLVLLAMGIALAAGWVGHRIAQVRAATRDSKRG